MKPLLGSCRFVAAHLSVAALVLVGSACVDKGPSQPSKKIDPAYIQENLLAAPPTDMTHAIDADFGGKVVYLGNSVEGTEVTPGAKLRVTHYWKVIDAPGSNWRVFSHLSGTAQGDWMNIDYTDMRHGHGPDKWVAGQIIRDIQDFQLRGDWKSPTAVLSVGLYRKGGQTVNDRMPIVGGTTNGEMQVVTFKVDVAKAPARQATIVRKASGPITIDGRADEPAWKDAVMSPAFQTAEGSPAPSGETTTKMLWDDESLYVFIHVEDTDIFSQYKNQDDPLWKEDVVELFIDADKNGRGYVELQVNPNNAHFDAWFQTTRAQPPESTWNANMRSAVVINGTADVRDDKDTGWDVEIAIPLTAVRGQDAAMAVKVPPSVGDTWRLNVVRVDGGPGGKIAASSWNQITYQDFHALGRMLPITFANTDGTVTPAPTTEEAAATPPGDVDPNAAPSDPAVPAVKPAEAKPQGQAPAPAPKAVPAAGQERTEPASSPAAPRRVVRPDQEPGAKPAAPAPTP